MRRRFLVFLKLAVAVLLAVWLVRRTGSVAEVWRTLQQLDSTDLAASVLCLLAAVALNGMRWRAVLQQMGAPAPLRVTMVGTFEGMFFNLFLPTGFGGDAARAYRLYDWGLDVSATVGSALIDRALGLWGLSLVILLCAPLSTVLDNVAFGGLILAAAALVAVGGVAAALIGRWAERLRGPSWARPLLSFMASYGRVVLGRRFVTTILPVLLCASLAVVLCLWFALRSVGLAVGLPDTAVTAQSAAFMAVLPVSVGGWGVREGTLVFLLEALGVSSPAALAASAAHGLSLIVVGAVGAAVWFLAPYRGNPDEGAQNPASPSSGRL